MVPFSWTFRARWPVWQLSSASLNLQHPVPSRFGVGEPWKAIPKIRKWRNEPTGILHESAGISTSHVVLHLSLCVGEFIQPNTKGLRITSLPRFHSGLPRLGTRPGYRLYGCLSIDFLISFVSSCHIVIPTTFSHMIRRTETCMTRAMPEHPAYA